MTAWTCLCSGFGHSTKLVWHYFLSRCFWLPGLDYAQRYLVVSYPSINQVWLCLALWGKKTQQAENPSLSISMTWPSPLCPPSLLSSASHCLNMAAEHPKVIHSFCSSRYANQWKWWFVMIGRCFSPALPFSMKVFLPLPSCFPYGSPGLEMGEIWGVKG